MHYLFSTLTITLVFCALFVFYFNYYVGVLRTICFLLSLLRWWSAHYLFSTFTITLVFCALFVFYSLIHGFFAHYLFSTFTIMLVFCALFFFTFTITLMFCALFVFYLNYYVCVLRTICFLL